MPHAVGVHPPHLVVQAGVMAQGIRSSPPLAPDNPGKGIQRALPGHFGVASVMVCDQVETKCSSR